mgnify:CR=1 FL=1
MADDLRPVTQDAELTALLIDNPLIYDTGAEQRFFPSGRTLYNFGEPSWGQWRIEAGRYCSQWPPGDDWTCYDVAHDGYAAVQFTDDWGNVTIGTFAE